MFRVLRADLAGRRLCSCGCSARRADTIVIGSKNFPEQALLGEILAQHLEARTHLRVERRFYLAGSYICQQALLAGRIDAYVEYTGTALTAILHDPDRKRSHRRVRESAGGVRSGDFASTCCLRSDSTTRSPS